MTPQDEIKKILDRAERATSGPWIRRGWHVEHKNRHTIRLEINLTGIVNDIGPTADFVAASRTDVPRLCKALLVALEIIESEGASTSLVIKQLRGDLSNTKQKEE